MDKNELWYIVTENTGDWNNLFVVKAKNKKEAIQKVFNNYFASKNNYAKENGYALFLKKNMSAILLDKMYKNENGVLTLN